MNRNKKEKTEYDVIVIGAGPGSLSAAKAASRAADTAGEGAERRVAILERDDIPGGILNQCLHDGFGIVRYGDQLSGPEYARIEEEEARESGAVILTGHTVTEIGRIQDEAGGGMFAVTAISRDGRQEFRTKAIVLATGCRERTRGMLSVPGTRPAGIFTAGVAQNLINRKNIMVGRRVVLLGSGDIGLIMARRLTLEGAEVICAAEVMPEPAGLARNVRQCLLDYEIPLYLNTTVTDIRGKGRLEGVELSRVDDRLQPVPGTSRWVDCDTLILSVGLIPENEVAKTAGVILDPKTGGAKTDVFLQTSVAGIFACGNAREVMDLADFVSDQGEIAGENAAKYARGLPLGRWEKNPHNAARKGMPEEGSVTCTLCPKGCLITAEPAGGRGPDGRAEPVGKPAYVITGNGCPRGEAFALQEMTDPQRILTTTIRVETEGSEVRLIPVRSDRPVPLREIRKLAKELRELTIPGPRASAIRRGDILAEGLGENGINMVAEA